MAAALVEGQFSAVAAVHAVRPAIAAAASEAADRLKSGNGRILYVGAGASGRIGVQDGVELAPTFGWPSDRLVYLMAGGRATLDGSVEGAEDDTGAATREIEDLSLTAQDVAICIAASGRTPYVVAAAEAAKAAGALVIAVVNVADSKVQLYADHTIAMLTGAEVLAGSTRMAAGTAQKVALNALSTIIMARLHRVHDNVMVSLSSSNEKLDKRRVEILRHVVPSAHQEASQALASSGGDIKLAALGLHGADKETARKILERHDGNLRAALSELGS